MVVAGAISFQIVDARKGRLRVLSNPRKQCRLAVLGDRSLALWDGPYVNEKFSDGVRSSNDDFGEERAMIGSLGGTGRSQSFNATTELPKRIGRYLCEEWGGIWLLRVMATFPLLESKVRSKLGCARGCNVQRA